MENTKIEWATHTFNPWEGCTKVSAGCANCYAENRNARFGGGEAPNWGKGAPRRRTSEANWNLPRKWNREAEKMGTRPRVFCASLADVFDAEVADGWRFELFELIYQTQHLDWMILTKRPENIRPMLRKLQYLGAAKRPILNPYVEWLRMWDGGWPIPRNIWLGTSVENQSSAIKRIPYLLDVPAKIHFLSCEPLLGSLDLTMVEAFDTQVTPFKVDWVICGGESGPGARPMHLDWARSLRAQCNAAGVAFHFKQWGEWAPVELERECWHDFMDLNGKIGQCRQCADGNWVQDPRGPSPAIIEKIGKKRAGRLLDGRTWDEVPEVTS